jgi:hypothetical protein
MTEKLLQYIWQFQYFNKHQLVTESEYPESFQIISPGNFNTDQGPDFQEARIKIGQQIWIGNVEIHVLASDWIRHGHAQDPNYKNVVLHVVWENDLAAPVCQLPMLVLNHRVPKLLLQQYEEWMMSPSFIPCGSRISTTPDIIFLKWKERLLIERLQRKTRLINTYLETNKNHWEEVFWWLLARNFGITVNGESFEAMARSIPIVLMAKHKNQIHQLEALFFGQAGLLGARFTEAYPMMLKKEYLFLKKKYGLKPIFLPVHFLRMRPVNFPTVRLAQLAMLLHRSEHLFSKVLAIENLSDLREMLNLTANDYWHYHFRFEETAAYQPKNLGSQMIDNIIINTLVPIVFAYGHFHAEPGYKDKVLHWLEMMAAEKNRISSRFFAFGIKAENSYDTQALYELKSRYCDEKNCLSCAVGNYLLKSSH